MVVNGSLRPFFPTSKVRFLRCLFHSARWIKMSQKWCLFCFHCMLIHCPVSKSFLPHTALVSERCEFIDPIILPILRERGFAADSVDIYQFIRTQMNKYFYANRREHWMANRKRPSSLLCSVIGIQALMHKWRPENYAIDLIKNLWCELPNVHFRPPHSDNISMFRLRHCALNC